MTAFPAVPQSLEFDVLVIGSGLAGLYCCLQLLQRQPSIRIALCSKGELQECNSRYAQGGIAAVSQQHDSFALHKADTLRAGDGLCYEPAVDLVIQKAPGIIKDLLGYQVPFRQLANGDFDLAQEGGHSKRRIYNTGDQTGELITSALLSAAAEQKQIQFFEDHIAINLIAYYHPHQIDNQGEVVGAYVLDCKNNCIKTFAAHAVVLATGGAGKTYRYTTNSMVATGDGVAMAYRAGARIGNMEFYQFHPTVLHHPELNNFLISEAVRGEGAFLLHPQTGARFMENYAPEQKELATRDVVARAIFNEIERGELGFVYLDIRHQSKAFLQKRFPHIYQTLASLGIDMSQDLIPVIPAAHYQCGGVLTNLKGQSDLERLFALGEVAFTGLHGANRLASNSLLEALVMAAESVSAILEKVNQPSRTIDRIPTWHSPQTVNMRRASQINAHWRGLRGEMTSYAGIVRTQAGLQDVLQLIINRKQIIEEYYWQHWITRDLIELRNIVMNAELIVKAALSRRESRGGHYREDFPQKNSFAQESIACLSSPPSPFIS